MNQQQLLSFVFGLGLVLLTACTAKETAQQLQLAPFFDLEGYMNGQIDSLQQLKPRVLKTISFNDHSEDHILDTLNFEHELTIFRDADINRPAWLERYQVDSVVHQGQLTTLKYTALDETLKTQHLQVEFVKGIIAKVAVKTQAHTVLAQSSQVLLYFPDEGYRIQTQQDGMATKSSTILIEASFVKR